MPLGHLLLHLHAHLPYVRHPERDFFLEETWLFEAITETYIPILTRLERLSEQGVPARLSMTWSPSLCEMLADGLLQERYRRHLLRLGDLAAREVETKRRSSYAAAAVMYRDHFRFCLEQLDRWDGQLLAWVRAMQARGVLEPVTCGATHALLPLLATRAGRRAQIAVAVANYRKHFGHDPDGIWLPECGYATALDELLAEAGIRYFFLDSHALYFGQPRPRYGVYAPVYLDNGVAAFARDPESGRSVWSSRAGYPGNPVYREFYRDLGYDGDYDYVRAYLHADGQRHHLGLKYHRITGRVELHEKAPYDPTPAFRQAMDDAGNFVFNRLHQCRYLHDLLRSRPLVVSPYDAELFGHWWFEGPQFLESVFHTLHACPELAAVTGSDFLDAHTLHQVLAPCPSTWGENGYYGVWLNPANDWIYPHLHIAEHRLHDLVRAHPEPDHWQERALDQMARELLLAQSSDWAFIMTTGTSPTYAARRTREHLDRFNTLHAQLAEERLDPETVATIEKRDPIFPEIDHRVYA